MPTPLDKVPDEVKVNFAIHQSLEERKQAGLDTMLLCETPGYHTWAGHARQANHLCERVPRACVPCCKRLGGCKKHPLQAGDLNGLPLPVNALQTSQPGNGATASSMPVASPTGVESTTPGPFARPLPAEYGRVFVATHQVRQKRAEDTAAQEKAHDDLLRTVTIIFWDGTPVQAPWIHRVQGDQVGQISLSLHPEVAQCVSAQTGNLVSVFEPCHAQWVSQMIQVPIPVSTSGRILLCMVNATDEDYNGLKSEIERLSEVVPMTVAHKHMHMFSDGVECCIKVSKAVSEPTGTIPAGETAVTGCPPLDISKLPFKYVCTHVAGMDAMIHVEHGIQDAFPGTTFVHLTFYKVCTVYQQARELQILDQYVAYGESEEGLWTKMYKRVEDLLEGESLHTWLQSWTDDTMTRQWDRGVHVPTNVPQVVVSPPAGPQDASQPEACATPPQSLQALKEWVGFHPFGPSEDDPIESEDEHWPPVCVWLAPNSTFDIRIEESQKLFGCEKECIHLVSLEGFTEVTYMGKHFHVHSDLHQDSLVVGEALRMGEAAAWWDWFACMAFDYGERLSSAYHMSALWDPCDDSCPWMVAISFVEGYIWWAATAHELCWYTQEEVTDGTSTEFMYPLPHRDPSGGFEDTLNAFTHFVYTEMKRTEIFVDFRGTPSECHSLHRCAFTKCDQDSSVMLDDNGGAWDRGKSHLDYYSSTHICGHMCMRLHLGAMPQGA
ncbi:hypothetical protein K439DRAFT_1618836 [Ramaria rubella]|nr:hypothetical protein K439DRAFT_1618836 [Ramaria rubella]